MGGGGSNFKEEKYFELWNETFTYDQSCCGLKWVRMLRENLYTLPEHIDRKKDSRCLESLLKTYMGLIRRTGYNVHCTNHKVFFCMNSGSSMIRLGCDGVWRAVTGNLPQQPPHLHPLILALSKLALGQSCRLLPHLCI